jgi:GT2 family glycosyltransferase
MKEKPSVSVQIINWNGVRFLKDCFDSLLKQDYPNFELVLVDNGSKDGSIKFIKESYDKEIKSGRIRIEVLKKNYGLAEGYNISYSRCTSDYVLLINNDTISPEKNLISNMVARAEKDRSIALVGASIYPFNTNLKKIKSVERPGTLSLALTNTLRYLKGNKVFYVSGCCCLIRKELIDCPFDGDYFAYSEDVYLGWKSILMDYSNVQEPTARILHYGSGTSGTGSPFVRYYAERNRILNCLIFYEGSTLIKILPLLLIYSLVAGAFFLQRPKVFFSFLKAHLWIITHPIKIIKKRNAVQKYRKISDSKVLGMLSTEIFLMETKITSFYISLRKRKTAMRFIEHFSKLLNRAVKLYSGAVGLKTIDTK